ncbi:MAG: ribose-phosphate pyrophosphokinase [Candidatus Bathyarchaeota archaeon]|nr:MAG: ribose-phosphate pyrophosphokinase [Candidatus Bathyarchaeota archaeon]
MIVLPGPASQELGNRIASQLNAKLIPIVFKKFPDGESYIRIQGDVRGKHVVAVQTTSRPQEERMIQLLLMISAAKNHNARKITAVIPYFAYSRQDRAFLQGEACSAKVFIQILEACGVSDIITVNAHNPEAIRSCSVPVKDISAIPLLAKHFKSKGFESAVSLSMGKKGLSTAKEAAKILEGPSDYIPTRRDVHTGAVTIEEKPLNVEGRTAILFDDIISSGGTMMKAVFHTKNQGASRVYAACVHPLMTEDTRKKIIGCGADGVIGTDSVQSPISVVSVAPAVARALSQKEPKP